MNYGAGQHGRKQRKKHRRKKSTGRKPNDAKADCATRTIDLYWYGAQRKKCVLRRKQFVWRLIDGKAEYVHYRIFDNPNSTDLPPVDGVRNGKFSTERHSTHRYEEPGEFIVTLYVEGPEGKACRARIWEVTLP